MSDKNLCISISGDVDEAKALSKPPEDSQGTNTTLHAHTWLWCAVYLRFYSMLNASYFTIEMICERFVSNISNLVLISSRWWEWLRCRGGAGENGEASLPTHTEQILISTLGSVSLTIYYLTRLCNGSTRCPSCHALWSGGLASGRYRLLPASRWVPAGGFGEIFAKNGEMTVTWAHLRTAHSAPVLSVGMFLSWSKCVVWIWCFVVWCISAYDGSDEIGFTVHLSGNVSLAPPINEVHPRHMTPHII